MIPTGSIGRNAVGILATVYTSLVPFILLNKPFDVLSQFSGGNCTLADHIREPGVYPAGRLDRDSEGLLILTDDGKLQARITQPSRKLAKQYWVQVEGIPSKDQLDKLRMGVQLKDGRAHALLVDVIAEPDALWDRVPPIRERRTVPTSWLNLAIDEGRNRQVRRMTAAVELPTLRLVRHRIGPWQLASLRPGESRSFDNQTAWKDLEA